MNIKRKCLNCGGDIPLDRQSGAKYCKDSCKARFHEKKLMKELFSQTTTPALKGGDSTHNTQQTGPQKLLEGLQGVAIRTVHPGSLPVKAEVKNSPENAVQDVQYAQTEQKTEVPEPPAFIPVKVKVETEQYKKVKADLDKVFQEVARVQAAIRACDEQIERIKNTDFSLLPLTTTGIGGALAYNKADKKILPTLGGAMAGWGAGKLIDVLFFEKDRKKEAHQSIVKIQQKKKEWQQLLKQVAEVKKKGEDFILTIPRYEIKTIMRPNLLSGLKSMKPIPELNGQKLLPALLDGIKQKAEGKEENSLLASDPVSQMQDEAPEIETSDRIISSKALREMTYPALIFQTKWADFFGEPSNTFHCVVHGKPGEGKSTFCIQFAYYLAKHHGNTIYISGEEGFSKTLQQKIILTNADHPRLFFTDLKSFDEIKAEIPQHKFHFIFIDSLDTLRIDAAKLKELRAIHPGSALITISQSTKDGKMRGSQEIIHDADIAVCVHNGTAITTKNRFKEKEMRFNVFQKIK